MLATCRKEELWPHIREFADNAITHTTTTLNKLQVCASKVLCQKYTENATLWEVATC